MPSNHTKPVGRPPVDPVKRFWEKVDKSEDCWVWTASRDKDGYGGFSLRPRARILAHRFSWTLHYGPIPDGMFVCHHCDNPPCVRPEHLFLGTHQDNVDDMFKKGRGKRATGESHGTHTRPTSRPWGERHGLHKITADEARAVRARVLMGEMQCTVAAAFGISQTQVSRIMRGTRWKHLWTAPSH